MASSSRLDKIFLSFCYAALSSCQGLQGSVVSATASQMASSDFKGDGAAKLASTGLFKFLLLMSCYFRVPWSSSATSHSSSGRAAMQKQSNWQSNSASDWQHWQHGVSVFVGKACARLSTPRSQISERRAAVRLCLSMQVSGLGLSTGGGCSNEPRPVVARAQNPSRQSCL